MSILVLDYGGSNITVQCQRGGHAAPRRVGSKPVSYAGGETSSIRAELMVVPVVLQYLTPTDIAAIRALFALGAQVPCRGDVFNNASVTIVCSGVLSDEFLPSGPWFEGNLTLYEIGTSLGYANASGRSIVYFTNAVSPDDGSMNLATTDINVDNVNGWGGVTLLSGATPSTCSGPGSCAITTSSVPEFSWLTPGSPNGGTMAAPDAGRFLSSGGTADFWSTQDCKLRITVVRAGVDLQTWDTDWSNGSGGFSGGFITLTGPSLLFLAQVGDRLRFEVYARIALTANHADDGARQRIDFGAPGGGFHYGTFSYVGTALFQ